MRKAESKKWSLWGVTIVSAIALQSITLPLAAQTTSSQSEQFEAQKLEQQVWELEIQGKYSEAIPLEDVLKVKTSQKLCQSSDHNTNHGNIDKCL